MNAHSIRRVGALLGITVVLVAGSGAFWFTACSTTQNSNWSLFGLTFYVARNPSACPVHIMHRGTYQHFTTTLYGNPSYVYDNGVAIAAFTAQNDLGQAVGRYYQQSTAFVEHVYNTPVAAIDGQYEAATHGNDVIHLDVGALGGGTASFTQTHTYTIDSTTQILGPLTVNTGVTTTWRANGIGTDPHTFKWYRNDTLSTNATGTYSYSPSYPGVFRLRMIVIDQTTGWTDDLTDTVTANFSLTLNGPTNVNKPGGSCNWSVVAAGGVQPLTYSWQMDGANVGDNSAFLTADATGQAGTHHYLSIQVIDNNGTSRNINRTITLVNSGGLNCMP